MSRQPLLVLTALALAASAVCRAQPVAVPAASADDGIYSYRPASRDGIGKLYMGRETLGFLPQQHVLVFEKPR